MKKIIDKIQLIEVPNENVLSEDELLDFLGGDNCTSFTACSEIGKNICTLYTTDACTGAAEGALKCSTYIF